MIYLAALAVFVIGVSTLYLVWHYLAPLREPRSGKRERN